MTRLAQFAYEAGLYLLAWALLIGVAIVGAPR